MDTATRPLQGGAFTAREGDGNAPSGVVRDLELNGQLFDVLRDHARVLGEDVHILDTDEHLGAFLQL